MSGGVAVDFNFGLQDDKNQGVEGEGGILESCDVLSQRRMGWVTADCRASRLGAGDRKRARRERLNVVRQPVPGPVVRSREAE